MVLEGIRSDSLDYLRTILVRSLSSENVGINDVLKVKQYKNKKVVTFDAKRVGKDKGKGYFTRIKSDRVSHFFRQISYLKKETRHSDLFLSF